VYAEAYVTVHQYDIVLDVTVINRTSETLQNLCLELATMGDLKLVERPQNYTLSPGATKVIRCAAGLVSVGAQRCVDAGWADSLSTRFHPRAGLEKGHSLGLPCVLLLQCDFEGCV
jgi:hypothetical protein